ncbi:MAG: hypothetical protein ACXW4E_08805, partial [Anaerolineales bacterium]
MIVILATLTRETSAFILAFYFAINHKALLTRPTKGKLNQEQLEFLVVSICFLCTYVGLRLLLGYEHAIYQAFLFSRNMNLSNSLFGMLFFASMALIIITGAITKEISIFLVITLPYAVFIFLFAEPWEIRLWMPIILLLIIMKVRAYRPMIV